MATAPPRPDTELLERLRRRDLAAWDEIYRLYQDRLYGFAYRLTGNPHDAADLVQETFVRALPRLDRLPADRADIAAYLFATEKNLFLKGIERGKRLQPVEDVPEPEEPAGIEDDPQRSALLRRQQEEVRVANGKLAPRQRLVLALRELEDKSYAEIGELVGLNENAVAQLISRARQSLRDELRLVQVDRSKLSPECQAFLPLLSAHLDGQAKGAKLAQTLLHLEGCDDCQTALADMKEASRRYRAVVPPLVAVGALKNEIEDALGAAGYWNQPAGRTALAVSGLLRGRTLVVASVIALAVFGGLGSGLAVALTSNDDPGPTALAATTNPSDEPAPASSPSTVEAGTDETELAPATGETDAPASTASETAQAKGTTGDEEAVASETATTEQGGAEAATTDTETAETGETNETNEPQQARAPAAPTILSGPSDPTSSKRASFRFSAERADSYRCKLDAGSFAPCGASKGYGRLAPGRHTFLVRAVNEDGSGPAAAYSWTIEASPVLPTTTAPETTAPAPDTTPPSVSLTGTPPGSTTEPSATFTFSASEAATFACRLDGSGFSPCSSPHSYGGLPAGAHTFAVRATDEAGNTGDAASYSWTISPPSLPDLAIASLSNSSVTVTNVGTAPAGPFVLLVTVPGGTFTIGGLAAGASTTRTWSVCPTPTITATADSSGQVAEANEANNSASTSC